MRRAIRIGVLAAAALAAVALIAALLGDSGDEETAEPKLAGEQSARSVAIPVEVFEYGFNPSNAVIQAGQALVFRSAGKELHSVVPASRRGLRIFDAAERRGSARPVFTAPGVYVLTCEIHPQMRGRVTVVRDLDRYLARRGG